MSRESWLLWLLPVLLAACDEANPPSLQPDAAAAAPGADGGTPPPPVDGAITIDATTDDPARDAGHDAERDADRAGDSGRDASLAQDAASDAKIEPVLCSVEAPTACPDPAPRFADVTPIFMQRCASCHASNWTGPWPLDTYGHIADWQDTIRSNLLECTMPPPEADIPMTNEERLTILTWIRCGLPM